MKITQFDRPTVKALRERLDEALADVGLELGLSIKAGNARFGPTNVTFKVEAAVLDAEGSAQTKEATEFKQLAPLYGLQEADLGRTFMFRGKPYEIVGAKFNSPKYPILARNRSGKVYKFQVEDVKRLLPKAA